MLAYYGYYIAALGPIIPFVRGELGLSYTLSGLHLSMYAGGVGIMGVSSERIARRWGRQAAFWSGGAAMALGAFGLMLAPSVLVTLLGVLVMGLGGGLLLILIQSTLADQYGSQRAVALSEGNVLASLSGTLAPLLIGGLERTPIGWRGGLLIAIVAFGIAFLSGRRVPPPPVVDDGDHHVPTPLPLIFWLYWLLLFLCVAIEWCVLFWAAEFLVVRGFAAADAAAAVSVFLGAMLIGRGVGSVLARRVGALPLLAAALTTTLIGFPLFWLAPASALHLIGLFVTGLGVANLYPFGLSVAMSTVPRQADLASARLVLSSSLATLILPIALGSLADIVGIRTAYGIVPLLVALAVVLLAGARRTARRIAP